MRCVIIVVIAFAISVSAWDNDDLEVFDVVEEVNQNFYELMGVSPDASQQEIKTAFKKLTLKLHPDKNDSPDADVQFRNLVSVHNILKDPGKREKYNDVLKNGLPNWRSALYYYRHVRKMGLAEGSLILFIIITLGQYAVGWAAYAEKRYTAEQILNSRNKKSSKKSGFDTGLAEILEQLPRPSIRDTLPFQIPRFVWWLIATVPRDVWHEFKSLMKQREEEARRKKKEEEEEAAAAAANVTPAEGRGVRRRRGFVPPAVERAASPPCPLDPAPAPSDTEQQPKEDIDEPVVVGGLWTDEDLVELCRLVRRYPGGTPDRWACIARAMGRRAPEVAHMAAKLRDNGYRPPAQDEPVVVQEPPKKVKSRKSEESSGGSWSQQQQRALEAALAKHPKGGAGDRWQKIANSVPGKTKEECMQRCKYLSEVVRKQKQKEEEEANQREKADEQTDTQEQETDS